VQGFRDILLGTVPIPKDSEMFSLTNPAKKAQSEICNNNKLAFKELILSIDTSGGDGRVAFQLVCCCKNNVYKNGNMADTWKWLTTKYAPNIMPIKLELKSEFQQSKLQDTAKDLDIWISDLESSAPDLQRSRKTYWTKTSLSMS